MYIYIKVLNRTIYSNGWLYLLNFRLRKAFQLILHFNFQECGLDKDNYYLIKETLFICRKKSACQN